MEHSRRWQLHIGGSKMFELLFHAGMSVLDQSFCRISISTDWRRVKSQKMTYRSGKHVKKRLLIKKNFFKVASHKSRIPEMWCNKWRILEMGPPQIRNSWNVMPQMSRFLASNSFSISWLVFSVKKNGQNAHFCVKYTPLYGVATATKLECSRNVAGG